MSSADLVGERRSTWFGQRRKRVEDPRLLVGGGRYTDDFDLPGALEVAFVRSAVPHGRITSVDVEAARELPGVHAVFTAADLDRLGLGELAVKGVYGEQKSRSQPVLARDKVRFVGEPVAAIVADNRYIAEDAAELVWVDYESLGVVADVDTALAPGAPLLHDEWGDNVMLVERFGSGDFDAAAAGADLVFSETFATQRHTAVPMECRGVVATTDPVSGALTLYTSNQAPHRAKTNLAEYLGWPENRIRIVAPDVGGGFGVKDRVAVEEVLVAVMASELGRPVKWIEDRREHFFSTNHARQQRHHVEVAVRADGRILALRDHYLSDVGAYASTAVGVAPSLLAGEQLIGPYDIQNYTAELKVVVTNKVPGGGFRAFGMQQAAFVMERTIDMIAARLGLDPVAVRRINFVPQSAFPYTSGSGARYDNGEYETALDHALALAGYDEWRRRQAEARERGQLIGIGICSMVEPTGEGPSRSHGQLGWEVPGYENVTVAMDATGTVTLSMGMAPQGQGHQTVFAQIAADELGVHPDDIRVVQGDTANTPYAVAGAIGSRGATLGGAAVIHASRKVRDKLARQAAHMLEAGVDDIELRDGTAAVRGAEHLGMPVREVAAALLMAVDIPDGLEPSLDERALYDPPYLAYSFGTHIAVVDVDPETGLIAYLDYAIVYDCGRVINPMIVEGQLIGGLGHGIGGAVLEELVYDADGQLVTTSFMDYLLPTACDMPTVKVELIETPNPAAVNTGGIKGVGQGSTIAAPAAVGNAVEDALRHLGAVVRHTPLSPDHIWSLINEQEKTQ
jgi:carbon-monoxide dehydrogenase large subunit